jgi:pre-mRNA-splicing factor ATP-dependent RNA helicase DHX15/PRP43
MTGSAPRDNPYLAHLHPFQRGAGPSGSNLVTKEPLYGFLPRKVNGAQVRTAMVSSTG